MFVSFAPLFPLKRKDEFPNLVLHLKVLYNIELEKNHTLAKTDMLAKRTFGSAAYYVAICLTHSTELIY